MEARGLDVVLIDDHALFVRGLALLLDACAGERIRVVGTTEEATMALPLVARCRPDVALVDLAMPAPGGLEVIRELRRRHSHLGIVALSGVSGVAAPLEALRAGADGFLPKTSDPHELLHPLLATLHGWQVLPRDLLAHLMTSANRPGSDVLQRIDADERTLWCDIARGVRNDELARTRHLSERTVKRSVAALLRKIGAHNRIEAAALAGACGLLDAAVGRIATAGPGQASAWHGEAAATA